MHFSVLRVVRHCERLVPAYPYAVSPCGSTEELRKVLVSGMSNAFWSCKSCRDDFDAAGLAYRYTP